MKGLDLNKTINGIPLWKSNRKNPECPLSPIRACVVSRVIFRNTSQITCAIKNNEAFKLATKDGIVIATELDAEIAMKPDGLSYLQYYGTAAF